MPKLFIGPMSSQIILAGCDFEEVGFIPSRRQIDFDGGYVGYSTQSFVDFVKYINPSTIIERDHGGPGQGSSPYRVSLNYDCEYFDIIHIDPWKNVTRFEDGIQQTISLIKYCNEINKNIKFEIGTEESIYTFSNEQYINLLNQLQIKLSFKEWKQILYVVVQSGVGLDLPNMKNTGIFDAVKLEQQANIIHSYGFLCKEHNGDYLSTVDINNRVMCGIDAINIAPEFGQIQTKVILDFLETNDILRWNNICWKHLDKWRKWGTPDSDYKEIIVGGHYTFQDPDFINMISKVEGWQVKVQQCMQERIKEILEAFQ